MPMSRNAVLALVALVVLFAGAFALGMRYDDRVDGYRTVFFDAERMAELQTEHVDATGEPGFPVEVAPGETVTVAGQPFTPAAGNTVQVTIGASGSSCSACTQKPSATSSRVRPTRWADRMKATRRSVGCA